jgi:Collagen triple helix repeat (20 copies)
MRRHLSYANVAATLALVFAMSGGALAANSYLINSTKQINPKVLKKLTGKAGKTGKVGPAGATGAIGVTGAAGATGKEGKEGKPGPFVTTLPSGQTLRGNYAGRAYGGEAAGQEMQIPITFAFPLASAPTAHYIVFGEAPPAQCPGTPSEPEAEAGNLCVYEAAAAINSQEMRVFDPIGGGNDEANRFGAGVAAASKVAKEEFRVRGSWAVTAP